MSPYSVVASAITAGAARDLVALVAPTNKYVAVRKVTVTPDADTTDHIVYELYKGSAASSGTLLTPVRTDGWPGAHSGQVATDRAYAGSARSLPTTTKDATAFARRGAPLIYAWEWCDDEGAMAQLAPGEVLILRQVTTTTVATSVTLDFEVL